jgi:thymidylate synthase (FAD)
MIKIITQPSVFLVGEQTVNSIELEQFLRNHDVEWGSDSEVPAEVLAETAGRVCYMSFAKPRPGGNAAYLGHIKEVGHGSVLEHAVWNFIFTGVSRTLTHELVRHRAGWGYSQLSQRYVDESEGEYVLPHDLREEWEACADWFAGDKTVNPTPGMWAASKWQNSVLDSHLAYVDQMNYQLVKQYNLRYPQDGYTTIEQVREALSRNKSGISTEIRKAARQAARSVLPNCTETKIFATANARAIRHFLEQRGSRHAEPEIRKLANAVHAMMAEASPNLFGDYRRVELPDGTYELQTDFPKV